MEHFVKSGIYTAGLSTRYSSSIITRTDLSNRNLSSKLTLGMRFPSTRVVRLCDARSIQLQKALPSDGRWRIVVFPGDLKDKMVAERLESLGKYLGSADSFIRKYTPSVSDVDSLIETIVILSGSSQGLEQEEIPDFFWPETGKWKMRNLHKVYIDDESYDSGHGRAYNLYGINENKGVIVVVRPDQYISAVVALEDHELLADFFDGFILSS